MRLTVSRKTTKKISWLIDRYKSQSNMFFNFIAAVKWPKF